MCAALSFFPPGPPVNVCAALFWRWGGSVRCDFVGHCVCGSGRLWSWSWSSSWYEVIYLLTAVGLSPGGSSTVHIYTQTIHRMTQNKQYTERHKTNNTQNNTTIWESAGRAPSWLDLPWHLPYNWGKSKQLRKKEKVFRDTSWIWAECCLDIGTCCVLALWSLMWFQ